MNTTATATEAAGTILAIIVMNDGSRIQREVAYTTKHRFGWQHAMLKLGAEIGTAIDPDAIESLVTITGSNVTNYAGPSEAGEILGLDFGGAD